MSTSLRPGLAHSEISAQTVHGARMHPRSRGSGAGRLAARQAGGWLGPAPCRTSTPGGRSEYGRWGGAGRPCCRGAAARRAAAAPRGPRAGVANRGSPGRVRRSRPARRACRRRSCGCNTPEPGAFRQGQRHTVVHTRRSGGGPQQPVKAGMGGRPTPHWCEG